MMENAAAQYAAVQKKYASRPSIWQRLASHSDIGSSVLVSTRFGPQDCKTRLASAHGQPFGRP